MEKEKQDLPNKILNNLFEVWCDQKKMKGEIKIVKGQNI